MDVPTRLLLKLANNTSAYCQKTNAAGDNFKVISFEFDCKLLMRACAYICVQKAAWRYRVLLGNHRLFTDAEVLGLYKTHVLSVVEYRALAVYHAASSTFESLTSVVMARRVSTSELD